jgi:hypothetical protein
VTDPQSPDALEGALLDYLLGADVDASARGSVEAALASDPALAREKAALEALLRAEEEAHDVTLDSGAAARVAARVRDRVGREEERTAREARRPSPATRWARMLALSVALHGLLLAVVSVAMRTEEKRARAEGRDDDLVAAVGSDGERLEPREIPLEPPESPEAPTLLAFEVEPLPAERLLLEEAETLEPPFVGERADWLAYPPSAARVLLPRTNERLKDLLLARAHLPPGTLGGVRRSLDAIAARQGPDGSFEPAAGRGRAYATAIAVLPFLGDGQSSRSGSHERTVARAIAWLRENAASVATPAERGAVTLALAEDSMLAYGSLTPAEAEARRAELVAAAAALDAAPVGAAGDAAAAVWPSLARRALDRAGVESPPDAPGPWTTLLASADVAEAGDPATALFQGTALLLADRLPAGAADVLRWGEGVGGRLFVRLDPATGLARDGASDAERVETTALIVLALEVVFRTY